MNPIETCTNPQQSKTQLNAKHISYEILYMWIATSDLFYDIPGEVAAKGRGG